MNSKSNCPLNKFKPCKETGCAWFIQIRGKNPQTEQEVDDWGCAIAWMPILQIETAQQSMHVGAAVESFRNEMMRANASSLQLLLAAAGNDSKLVEG